MFPVNILIFCYLCCAHARVLSSPLDLVDVALGKQTMQWPHRPSENDCNLLFPEKGKQAYFYVDLQQKYPIILVNISGFSLHGEARLKIFADNEVCGESTFRNGVAVFQCFKHPKGRLLKIVTRSVVKLCKVKVYTCKPGKRGSNCQKSCDNSTYGIACILPCRCKNNTNCNSKTGHCSSGCNDFNSERTHNCYYKSVSLRSKVSRYTHTKSAATDIQVLPPRRISHTILKTAEWFSSVDQQVMLSCVDLKAERNYATVKITFNLEVSLRAVDITYSIADISPPYSIQIFVDHQSCFGITTSRHLTAGKHRFECQRKNLKGKMIRILHTTHNTSKHKRFALALCGIEILECSKGYYGPFCRLPCNCMGSTCDPLTGACRGRSCARGSRGRNCAATDLTLLHEATFTTIPSISSGSPQETSRNTLLWWVLQLDGVFHIHWVTLHIAKSDTVNVRTFYVLTDTASRPENVLADTQLKMTGLGNTGVYHHGSGSVDIQYTGPAQTITILTLWDSLGSLPSLDNVQVWSCMDGTFGPACEGLCNCKDPDEVCDWVTGACSSGCAEGYSGVDCQQPCVDGSTDSTCWKECHCYLDLFSECGPGIMLCDSGCQEGWMGVACDIPCPPGYYGPDCMEECGDCIPGPNNEICDRQNGFCQLGCTNDLDTPTCKNYTELEEGLGTRASKVGIGAAIDPDDNGDREQSGPKTMDALKIIAIGLIASVAAAGILCVCVRFCWARYTDPDHVGVRMKRLLSNDVNEQILREHRDYHERYVQKNVLNKAGQDIDDQDPKKAREKKTLRKTLWDLQRAEQARAQEDDGRCKPLQDNTQMKADLKVAEWVLRQDFNELINRRKERLKTYKGDILDMQESTYAISVIPLTEQDLHRLYDEVGPLAIP